jgi:transcriptional regulator with XRE-family HTH domain
MPTFAERLKELRHKAMMSQPELANKSGVPLPSLRGYEQAHREPYWDVIFRLARALGVSCEAFADCVAQAEPEKPRGRPRKER